MTNRESRSFKKDLIILLLVVFLLTASIRLFIRSINFGDVVVGGDDVSRYVQRFNEIRKMLSGEETVGYVTDNNAEINCAAGPISRNYFLTQYAVSPIIVDPKKCTGFIIGNFDSKQSADSTQNGKRQLIKDFGNGVILFKGEAK